MRGAPAPLAVIVSGNVEPDKAFAILEDALGHAVPGKLAAPASDDAPSRPDDHSRADRQATCRRAASVMSSGRRRREPAKPLAWRMLLYVLTHDYSGRLGRSAITDKGIVYYIGSALRTDGVTSWATISIGVDPDKADAMESELRAQLARLATEPANRIRIGGRTKPSARSRCDGRADQRRTNRQARPRIRRNRRPAHPRSAQRPTPDHHACRPRSGCTRFRPRYDHSRGRRGARPLINAASAGS